jgi:MFS family permease
VAGRVTTPAPHVGGKAWLALVLSAGGQTASGVLQSAPAFLVPEAVRGLHMSLPAAGMLAVAPTLGGALTLVLWGSIADRFSNRWVFATGLALATMALAAALPAHSGTVLTGWLCAAGAASAASNASSGRVIIGWFPPRRRGLAMGIRQMSAPLGAAVAALSVPVALGAGGLRLALGVPLIFLAVFTVGVAWLLRDPPLRAASNTPARTRRASSPYRESWFLWRRPRRVDACRGAPADDHHLRRRVAGARLRLAPGGGRAAGRRRTPARWRRPGADRLVE